MGFAKEIGAPFNLVEEIHKTGKFTRCDFAAGE